MPATPAPTPLQGYLPRDLYDLNSKFGSEAELRDAISLYHELGLKVIADIVINHRCAHYQVGAWVGGWWWWWCGSGGFRLRVPVGRGETWTMEVPLAGGQHMRGQELRVLVAARPPLLIAAQPPLILLALIALPLRKHRLLTPAGRRRQVE